MTLSLFVPLPVFVYGTLMQGEWNHTLVEPFVDRVEQATIRGFGMYSAGAFPYVVPIGDPSAVVSGHLLHLRDGWHEHALRLMDSLEGVPHHYQRVNVTARDQDGLPIGVWVYVQPMVTRGERVTRGDWRAWYAERWQAWARPIERRPWWRRALVKVSGR